MFSRHFFVKLKQIPSGKAGKIRVQQSQFHRTPRNLKLEASAAVSAPAVEDVYDPIYNPQGIVNLGTGTNYLMENEVRARLEYLRTLKQEDEWMVTDPEEISRDFRKAVGNFMNKFFRPNQAIQSEELKLTSNVTSCIDLLGAFLGNPSEIFLCPAPAYSRLFTGSTQYSGLDVLPVPLEIDSKAEGFKLNRQILQGALNMYEHEEGRIVRGIILTNPHNPTGQIYSPEVVLDIHDLCVTNGLELIMSEVYCLSVFSTQARFNSVLNYLLNESSNIHVLWGLTKDLCITGYHTAVLHSRNTQLMAKILDSNLFDNILLPEQQLLTLYIKDHDWIEQFFLATNHERMRRAFTRAKNKLESLGVQVFPSQAGFFLFCNFAHVLGPKNLEETSLEFFKLLQQNGVYVVPYWAMRCPVPGIFRLVFTAEDHIFDEGFNRIKNAVTQWRSTQQQ